LAAVAAVVTAYPHHLMAVVVGLVAIAVQFLVKQQAAVVAQKIPCQ
jgi:uncharacterized membrane-anchored protein